MKVVNLRKKRKLIPKTTKEAIAEAIREGKSAYEIASMTKLSEDDVRMAAKELRMVRALNENEGCVTRMATPEEMGEAPVVTVHTPETAKMIVEEEPPAVDEAPEPEPPRRRGRKPKAAAKAEAPRGRKKPGSKPGTKKERPVIVPGEALLGTIRILEGIGKDMFDFGAQDEENGTWLGVTYDQVVATLKLLRTIDKICQRLSAPVTMRKGG